ncbi:Dus-domain-containing protein [Thelephora ganbajun]|uniref:Dus-domain-containing protein n=1 Tax=Thelephora ganbajun TaxID=370292 RepID=A0ACB6Z7C3_THEGA|nr:Dus-domain-containing protein [Thelephora ganbajun]
MMLFTVFSTAILCLWSLLLTSGPMYTPIISIPTLVSPVLTPLLSPAHGSSILILIEVCDATVPLTLPTCDPFDAPVHFSTPPVVLGSRRALHLAVGLLGLGCASIVLCAKGVVRLVDRAAFVTSTPPDRPAYLFPSLPSFPPSLGEPDSNIDWTPLSQPDAPGPLRRQVLARNTGVMSRRMFRPSPADSGYEGSPLLSRHAVSKQRQSRLRIVTGIDADSPLPSGPLPAAELGSGSPGGDDTSLRGPSSTPLFNPSTYQADWTSSVATDDPFWATGFADRDSVYQTPLELAATKSPLTPHPHKNHISNPAGLCFAPAVTTPVPAVQTGVPDWKSAREARDGFLYLRAERGHAAPSRLYCDFVSRRTALSPARTPNIQALRDILESKKAMLSRFSEKRSALLSPPDIYPRSLNRSSRVRARASWTTPVYPAAFRTSPKSSHPLRQVPMKSEERKSKFDLPVDIAMLADERMLPDAGASSSSAPFETALTNSRKNNLSASVVETPDDPASTSIDVGLRLLLKAIGEIGERSWSLDSEASGEITASMDLTLGEAPSFLDDLFDLPIHHSSQAVAVSEDQDTRPAPSVPTPTVHGSPSDAVLEDKAIVNERSIPPLHNSPIPSPSTHSFETSLSLGRIHGFLNDILQSPVHRFSRPTFEAHDPCELYPSSSLDNLEVPEDMSLLMDQSAPPSPIGSPTRSGSPIPPFEEVLSRIRAQKAAAAAQMDRVLPSTGDLETVSAGQPGRLETSMSLGKIADILDDIWSPPVREFSNRVRFKVNQDVGRPCPSGTSSASAIHIPEDTSYPMEQSIPCALAESSSGLAASVPSFENVVQNLHGPAPPDNPPNTRYGVQSSSTTLRSRHSPTIRALTLYRNFLLDAVQYLKMPSANRKLEGYDFYRTVLGSPKYVVAPMVDQSELAWRKLCRRYGAGLAYTPMINAKMFAPTTKKTFREINFSILNGEEGGKEDRPLIVQFCGNDPQQILTSAKALEPYCDAVDINLGCPQDIAKKGKYGAFLQDEWDLIYNIINTLHKNLSIPVTAKFRVFPSIEKTVEYAKMLERAGAQILTCHGRIREQRGHNTGLADWDKIRAVKEAVSVPVFANGNILYHSDIDCCLEATGADAVMSAEGNLYNPTLFVPNPPGRPAYDSGLHLPHADLAFEYLHIVKELKTKTPLSAVKGHLFKLMRPGLARELDLRDRLGKIKGDDPLDEYLEVVEEMKRRMDRDMKQVEGLPIEQLITVDSALGIKILPHWLAQPYWRPLTPSAPSHSKEATT